MSELWGTYWWHCLHSIKCHCKRPNDCAHVMLHWSTQAFLFPAVLQDISTVQRVLFVGSSQSKDWLSCFCFSPRQCLSGVKDNCDKTEEKQPDVLSLFKNWKKKSKVRNLKRVCVGGEGFTSQSSSLSHLQPLFSFHDVYGVWPLGKKVDPSLTYRPDTHWQTTNPRKGQGRRGWEHLLPNRTNTSFKCSEELWERGSSYCGQAGTPECKTKLLSVQRSWKQQFGRKTQRWKFLHWASGR